MKTLSIVIATTLVALTIVGCAGLTERISEGDILLSAAVRAGTYSYIEDRNGQVDTEKAARVHGHAVSLRKYADRLERVTIGDLESHLIRQVDWQSMTLTEREGARVFIAFLSSYLQKKADEKLLPEDPDGHVRIAVDYMIDIVTDALSIYVR